VKKMMSMCWVGGWGLTYTFSKYVYYPTWK